MKKICTVIAMALHLSQVSAEVLYDIDFSSPTHTAGQSPALGGSAYPKNRPTEFGFPYGTAEVLSSYGDFDTQCLLLIPETAPLRPAVRLDFALSGMESFSRYTISADMILSSFEGGLDYLTFYFKTPIAHSISFQHDGSISQRGNGTTVGSFEFDQAFNFRADIDIENNNWSLFIDQNPIYSGIFHMPVPAYPDPPEQLTEMTMVLDYDDDTANVPVAVIDNFRVEAVPEPGTVSLLALGSAGIYCLRRRRSIWLKLTGV